ncbi:MAG: hypothetical protein NUV54_03595, partial [Candidatus Taylorbacteria bacterium]|nr:hypothetical protein [Candidatus Taylorbacteria bacterium]
MISKVQEKNRAIELRQKGMSYRDILEIVRVSKSSISLWLKDLPLTEEEKMLLKHRGDVNISRGRIKSATANRRNRLIREQIQFLRAQNEFSTFIRDPLFFIGVALYWAEGSKRDNTFQFTNSDPEMVTFMVRWCAKYLGVSTKNISCHLYLHKPYAHENCEKFWSKTSGIPLENFRKTVLKQTNLDFKKRANYKGCL